MSTYDNLKKLIQLKNSMTNNEKQTLLNKIDMFVLFGRITNEEYEDIVSTINEKYDNGTII